MENVNVFDSMPEKKRNKLAERGVKSQLDLCYLTPYKFFDFTKTSTLCKENVERYIVVKGIVDKVTKESGKYQGSKMISPSKIKVHLITANGEKLYITYMGMANMQDWLEAHFQKELYVGGKLDLFKDYFTMMTPEMTTDNPDHLRWLFVYPKYSGIGEHYLREKVVDALQTEPLAETIPVDVLSQTGIMGRRDALKALHYPKSKNQILHAVKRQLFEDLLYFSCCMENNSRMVSKGTIYNLKRQISYDKVTKTLPYELTEDQKSTIEALFAEAKEGKRLNALIQGDVGCGKSIIAFLLMLAMADSGYQSVIMAPTVVLAQQHFKELSSYAAICGYRVAFLGGKMSAKEKRETLAGIKDGKYALVVGTHATISERVEFCNLALSIVDEEHRFGVKQREALAKKAMSGVHTVSFSATPIPRTVAASIYGDTSIYEIKTMPKGRSPIITTIIEQEEEALSIVKREVSCGSQVYIVCPLINEEGTSEKRTVNKVAKFYEQALGMEVGIATGKMAKAEIAHTLERFTNNELKILVATTVVEVGVNVPNATAIVIEDAWCFGLAQLHQLRGRVGRGTKQGYCILHSDREAERLSVMCETTDGFQIAEKDLQLRGSGNLLGDEQSGYNRYLQEAIQYPKMFTAARKIAKSMVDAGTDAPLIDEMERRSDKIYVKMEKLKVFV